MRYATWEALKYPFADALGGVPPGIFGVVDKDETVLVWQGESQVSDECHGPCLKMEGDPQLDLVSAQIAWKNREKS